MSLVARNVHQGGSIGAGMNAVIKSGTKSFCGKVCTYYRNENPIGPKVKGATIDNPSPA